MNGARVEVLKQLMQVLEVTKEMENVNIKLDTLNKIAEVVNKLG